MTSGNTFFMFPYAATISFALLGFLRLQGYLAVLLVRYCCTKLKRGKKTVLAASEALMVTGNASKGKLTYRLSGVPKKAKKHVKLSAAGKLTVKKSLPRGKYALKVRVTQTATANYKG